MASTDQTDAPPHRFAQPVRATGAWAGWWRSWYRLLRLGGGLLTRVAMRPGFGNVVVLTVPGRRSGQARRLPLGLLRVGGAMYLGHPSGDTAWTLNVRAAAQVRVVSARLAPARYQAILLAPGSERDAVVHATFHQHPFPATLLYRLSADHVFGTGVFFRLQPLDIPDQPR
jgi:deazaflavin-dependent oxidoreductase (nitroreductase family)